MITIYSKPACTACLQASAILKAKNIPFVESKLDQDYDLGYLTEILAAVGQPAPRSFPQIFKNEDAEYIGGLTELKQKLSLGLI